MKSMADIEDYFKALANPTSTTEQHRRMAAVAEVALLVVKDFRGYLEEKAHKSISEIGNQGMEVATDILDVYNDGVEITANVTLVVHGGETTLVTPDGRVLEITKELAYELLGRKK